VHPHILIFALLVLDRLDLLVVLLFLGPINDAVQLGEDLVDVVELGHLIKLGILDNLLAQLLNPLLNELKAPAEDLLVTVAIVGPLKQNDQLPPVKGVV